MGTNVYVEMNKCGCCNRSDLVHIGKQSGGWAFNFRGYRLGRYATSESGKDIDELLTSDLVTWAQWKEFLKDKPLVNEYGDSVEYDAFVQQVEGWGSPGFVASNGIKNLDHIKYVLNTYLSLRDSYCNPDLHWHDEAGYSFSSTEFS